VIFFLAFLALLLLLPSELGCHCPSVAKMLSPTPSARLLVPFVVFGCLLLSIQAFTTTGLNRWEFFSIVRSSATDDAVDSGEADDAIDAFSESIVEATERATESTVASFKGMLGRENLKRHLVLL
jgi:hypothetical protein